MGGASGKGNTNSPVTQYDPNDPRSPSFKRTPVSTPAASWRQRAEIARSMANAVDPRSPGLMRTPVQEHQDGLVEPVTPLTLSYDDYNKMNPEDPRSPTSFRTPLTHTQGLPYDSTTVIACGPFMDDTLVITPAEDPEEGTQDADVTVTASSIINNPLADLSIISSTEIKATEEETTTQEEEKITIKDSINDIEVPSSPLGASACSIEEEHDGAERIIEKVIQPSTISSPLLAERKRKKAPTKQLQSPLKKSYSSPGIVENNENNTNNASSPLITRKTTPNTPRRSINNSGNITPNNTNNTTNTRKTTPNKRTPTTPKTSRRLSSVQRAPLSPITVHSKRNSDSLVNSGNFIL